MRVISIVGNVSKGAKDTMVSKARFLAIYVVDLAIRAFAVA